MSLIWNGYQFVNVPDGMNSQPSYGATPQTFANSTPHPTFGTTVQPTAQAGAIEYVNGIEGAKAYFMQPNSMKLLLDSDSQFFYIKKSDMQNKATIKVYEYKEVDLDGVKPKESKPDIDLSGYVKKKDFDSLKKLVDKLAKKGEVTDE